MFKIFDMSYYPMFFLTIFYFIFGYIYGSLINNKVFPSYQKGLKTSQLIIRIICMLNVVVFTFFFLAHVTKVFTKNLKIDQIYVDASKTVFGFSFFKVQHILQQHMNDLNRRTKLT